MSPSASTRNQRPRHAATLSLANIVSRLTCSLFMKSNDILRSLAPPLHDPPPTHAPRRSSISRPRQLRRAAAKSQSTVYVHPIHSLPVEILGLVIQSGADEDMFFPITFSHVCRYWRQIALQNPTIWRRITLTSQSQMWLERIHRAQGCSLDIQLSPSQQIRSGARRLQELDPYTVNWYMQVPQPYIQQWRSLDIHFSEYSPYLWKSVMACCNCPAPSLEELSLVYRLNDDTEEFVPFMGYAPRLRRVTLDGIRLAWFPSLFANLTYLDYTHHGLTSGHQAVHDVASILSISSRLIELRILFPRGQIARLPPRSHSEVKSIVLPDLKQLQLTCNGSDIPYELAHLVTLMTTPSLTTLRFIDLTRSHQSFPSLKSFFYVYALPPSLRYVSIGHGWYNPKMIYAMSHSMPHLVSIHVKRLRNPEQVLKMKPRVRLIPSFGSRGSGRIQYNNYPDIRCPPRQEYQ